MHTTCLGTHVDMHTYMFTPLYVNTHGIHVRSSCVNDICQICKTHLCVNIRIFSTGIVGYFTIDFLTFIDGKSGEQQLWALDLDVRYSDTVGTNHQYDY